MQLEIEKDDYDNFTDAYLKAKAEAQTRMDEALLRYDYSTSNGIIYTWCFLVARNKWFELFITIIILLNSVALALYEPTLESTEGRNYYINIFEYSFLGVYIIELIIRVIADGLWVPRNYTVPSYLKQSGNVLDCIIVLTGILEIFLHQIVGIGNTGISALRCFRAFRILNAAKRFRSLTLVIETLVASIYPLSGVIGMYFAVLTLFVVFGMQLYSGAMNRACYFDDNLTQVAIRACGNASGTFQCGLGQTCFKLAELPANAQDMRVPFNGTASFDNAGIAYLTVFSVATQEGWTDVMFALNDSMGADGNWAYFYSVIFICGYLLLNMIVGVLAGLYVKILDNSNVADAVKRREKEAALASRLEQRRSSNADNYEHSNWNYCHGLRTVVETKSFEYFILGVILINACFLASDHHPMSDEMTDVLKQANYSFVTIYVIELCAKILGLGFYDFWKVYFNRFDAFITGMSVLELVLLESGVESAEVIGVFRCLRLFRIFRLANAFDEFHNFALGALHTVRGLGGVLACIALFLFVSSLVGMQLFGGQFYSRVNYDSFVGALFTSLQLEIAEGWNEVMQEAITVNGGPNSPGLLVSLFFLANIWIGHIVLIGILLAIAYTNLENILPAAALESLSTYQIKNRTYLTKKDVVDQDNTSLWLFPPDSSFRVLCSDVVRHRFFDPVILVCIIVSSILMSAEDVYDVDNPRNEILHYFDIVFTIIFVIELGLKVVSMGFVLGQDTYLRNSWNVLDFITVTISVIILCLGGNSAIKTVRIVRVLRPLRAVQRFPALQQVIESMLAAMKNIWALGLVVLLFLFCFAVLGVTLFKGRFNFCTDESIRMKADCVGTYTAYGFNNISSIEPREWKLHRLNFDNTGRAAETLFAIITMEEAPTVWQHAFDSTEIDEGPLLNNRREVMIYFVVYLYGMALFFLNIAMAVVVVSFSNHADHRLTQVGLTKTHAECLRYALNVDQPVDRLIAKRHWMSVKIIESPKFDYFMLGLVGVNVIVLLMTFDGQSDEYGAALEVANLVFIGIFTLEACVKIFILNPYHYFRDRWNVFDFAIVTAGIVDIALGDSVSFVFLRMLRAFRLIKVFQTKKIRFLFETFLKAMSTVPFILAIMFLCFYIYAIIGMNLFGQLPIDEDTSIHRYNNFRDFGSSMLVLFRTMTGEAWQDMLADTAVRAGLFCFALGVSVGLEGGGRRRRLDSRLVFFSFYTYFEGALWKLNAALCSLPVFAPSGRQRYVRRQAGIRPMRFGI